MLHISTTPFGRPVDAGLLAAQALASGETPCPAADKWQILRDLGRARRAFDVSDRDLMVLSALISFHPQTELTGDMTVVFPSNAVLAQRAHGMAESTLRRHLAALVKAGLIARHDSPNGKRYAVRGQGQAPDRAFGFDLAPLARRAAEISAAARAADFAATELRRLRETIVLRLRDCEKLVHFAMQDSTGPWDELSDAVALSKRALRRKLDRDGLSALDGLVAVLLTRIQAALPDVTTDKMIGNAARNERHIQDSNIMISESVCPREIKDQTKTAPTAKPEPSETLPLYLVLRACPEIAGYAPDGIRDWRDLVTAAGFVTPMMGITPETWHEAQRHLTPATAAIAVACILQSFERIAKPGAYLRSLARKGAEAAFSPGPMVMALLKADNLRAA